MFFSDKTNMMTCKFKFSHHFASFRTFSHSQQPPQFIVYLLLLLWRDKSPRNMQANTLQVTAEGIGMNPHFFSDLFFVFGFRFRGLFDSGMEGFHKSEG